ncbi:MAG: hypothetical protein QM719_05955 [Thermomonas sp.]
MGRPDDFMEEYRRLQDQTMQRLDTLANDIDAGRVPLEEGLKQADKLVLETQAQTAPLLALHQARIRRAKLHARIVVILVTVAVFGLACAVLAHRAGIVP